MGKCWEITNNLTCFCSPCPVMAKTLLAKDAWVFGLLKWMTVPSFLIKLTSSIPGILFTANFFNVDWSFLSSVAAVWWTIFFLRRGVPLIIHFISFILIHTYFFLSQSQHKIQWNFLNRIFPVKFHLIYIVYTPFPPIRTSSACAWSFFNFSGFIATELLFSLINENLVQLLVNWKRLRKGEEHRNTNSSSMEKW